jgi:hypothetical protein
MALPTMSLLRIPVSCGAYPIVMRRFFNDRALATNRWLYAAIAVLPIGWLLGCYFIGAPPDTDAVGFIQYDQAYYMAEARGHFDHGFHFFYGLAASPDYDTPRVYFRPQTLLLGALLKYARIDPGWVYMAFGVIATVVFFRLAVALYETVIGLGSPARYLVLPIFLWGGGLTVLYGLAIKLTSGGAIFALDTGGWGANLGRGVVYGIEGYYHTLFFGAVLAGLQRRYATALLLVAVTCMSHPFTGMELTSILVAWIALEYLFERIAAPPLWFTCGVALLLLMHVGYWLVALPWLSPEHAALAPTWQLPWVLHWYNEIAEYELVAFAALWQLRSKHRIAAALTDRTFRLLLAWFITAFALANHDLLISPRQPIHFTHGYVWVPLFLIGAPTLVAFAERFLLMRRRFAAPGLFALGGFLLLDNAAWLFGGGLDLAKNGMSDFFFPNPIYLSRNARDVLERLNNQAFEGGLVVSNAEPLSYAVIVYTPLRAWYSQRWNTPYPQTRRAELDALFRDSQDIDAWRRGKVIAIIERRKNPEAGPKLLALGYHRAYENADFEVLLRLPLLPSSQS